MQQLDIFEDSRDRMLLNDLADALAADDLAAARQAWQALAAEFPADPHLPAGQTLADALAEEAAHSGTPLAGRDAALALRTSIEQSLTPAARTLLGAGDAATWLSQRWRALAQRAHALPFQADAASAHAAALWLEAGQWAEAESAVLRIESWRRIPQALAWMAHARGRARGMDAAWPLLAELCWLAPQRLPGVLKRLPDAALHQLARRFEDDFDAPAGDVAWAWWPAWLLVEQPLLGAPLAPAESRGEQAPERAFALVKGLLHLERQARHADLMAQRQRLRELHAGLFAAYMRTR